MISIEDIIKMKKALQDVIEKEINNFEQETSCVVTSVNITAVYECERVVNSFIKIRVELP